MKNAFLIPLKLRYIKCVMGIKESNFGLTVKFKRTVFLQLPLDVIYVPIVFHKVHF